MLGRQFRDDDGHRIRRSLTGLSFALQVSRQLEDPFGHKTNQLPIDDLHTDFNERLWALTVKLFHKDEWPLQSAKKEYARSATDIHTIK